MTEMDRKGGHKDGPARKLPPPPPRAPTDKPDHPPAPDDGDADPIKVGVSLEMKVSLDANQYEKAGIFLSLTNIPSGASEADIIVAQATQKIVFDLLAEQMREKAASARRQFT